MELYLVRLHKSSTMSFAMGPCTLELANTAATIALDTVDAHACQPN